MRWSNVKRVKVLRPGSIQIEFDGCRHKRVKALADMIRTVNDDPQVLVGKEYPCLECGGDNSFEKGEG